jgi:hypothetical protein
MGNLGQALAHFFVTQRVRHFIGNGLALYGAVGRPRVPFLDAEVVRAIRGLDSKEFRRDRFHTRAIQDLEPKLVEFPFNKPIASGMTTLPISPFPSVLSKLKTHDVIMEHSNLDDLISQGDRGAALREGDAATVELLLTLAFAARVAEMRLGSKRP